MSSGIGPRHLEKSTASTSGKRFARASRARSRSTTMIFATPFS